MQDTYRQTNLRVVSSVLKPPPGGDALQLEYLHLIKAGGHSAGNLSVKFELEDFLQFVCM